MSEPWYPALLRMVSEPLTLASPPRLCHLHHALVGRQCDLGKLYPGRREKASIPARAQPLTSFVTFWPMAPLIPSFLIYKIGAIMLLPVWILPVLKTVVGTWKFSVNVKL